MIIGIRCTCRKQKQKNWRKIKNILISPRFSQTIYWKNEFTIARFESKIENYTRTCISANERSFGESTMILI